MSCSGSLQGLGAVAVELDTSIELTVLSHGRVKKADSDTTGEKSMLISCICRSTLPALSVADHVRLIEHPV